LQRAALSYRRGGGTSVTLNYGYGRGYSVRETIEALRRVSGCNFAVQYAARCRGDHDHDSGNEPQSHDARLDAETDNLETIAWHALAWEKTSTASAMAIFPRRLGV
jgi:UDP-glucose 4-epimerase